MRLMGIGQAAGDRRAGEAARAAISSPLLESSVQGATGILHGDYHLANVMFAPDRAQLAAIVDWEMSTLGDPLLDLGWLLATWPREGDPSVAAGSPYVQAGGLPQPEELVARYAERSDRSLDALPWYVAMA